MPDLINGAFELFGGVFILLNILQLLRDKQVKGIHWGSSIFFTSWGLWNCWYYPHLGQWASFAGGVVICVLNVVWLVLRIRYSRYPFAQRCTRKDGHLGPCNGLPCDRAIQRRIVDVAFNEATESTTVPSTEWADRIIDTATRPRHRRRWAWFDD